jgi:hypothetical protein
VYSRREIVPARIVVESNLRRVGGEAYRPGLGAAWSCPGNLEYGEGWEALNSTVHTGSNPVPAATIDQRILDRRARFRGLRTSAGLFPVGR